MYNVTRKVEEIFSPCEFCLSKVSIKKHINFYYVIFWVEKIAVQSNLFYIFFVEVFLIKQDFLVNEEIEFSKVQVVDSNGQKVGLMPTEKAIELAEEEGLDLVLVSPNPANPVCKILDYSKYKFEMNKKAKESKKKQKVIEVKEVRLSPNIDKHDLEVKAKNANKFIDAGNKVKVTMRFRGRELNFIEQGKEIMSDFRELIVDAQVDKEAKMEGKNLIMFLIPKQK